ncbi:YceI family protein [Coraliomargarita parva]|uniref:YceI family protein n=1 Tax=Coraliomargarita parva TaxID=3014050 RepID=UPI0022B4D4B6|nr:YceI family protein [Coraliomargarita parva]
MNTIQTLIFLPVCLLAAQLHAGNFKMDPAKSSLSVDVKASPPHKFTCVAQDFSCDIELAPDTLSVVSASCHFPFGSLDSEKASRDKKMREWIEISQYPEGVFTLTSESMDADGQTRLGSGQFSMHGQTREVELPYRIEQTEGKVIIEGSCELKYTNWDLEIIRLLFFTVKPDLTVHFHLEGQVQNDA